MSRSDSKEIVVVAASTSSADPPGNVAEVGSTSESSTSGKNSGSVLEGSSSSSTNNNIADSQTGKVSSSTSGSKNKYDNANTNSNTKEMSNLTPILDVHLGGEATGESSNESVRAKSYIVCLMSGDELFINKKDLLVAALQEHRDGKKAEQKRLEEDMERIKKETSKVEEKFSTAHEVYRVANESARLAIEAREKAMEELSAAIEKRVAARAKEKDAQDSVEAAGARVAVAEQQVDNAEEAASADVAREFLQQIQDGERENCDRGKGADGVKETDGGDSHMHTNMSGDISANEKGEIEVDAKFEERNQAGKKRARENDLLVAERSESGDETPPRKAAKWDEIQNQGAGFAGVDQEFGAIQPDEIFGGFVFNSPTPTSPSDLKFRSHSLFENNSDPTAVENSSKQNPSIHVSSELVRQFACEAIAGRRRREVHISCDIPIIEQIFCVHRDSGRVFEGDGVTVPESVLILGDAIVGDLKPNTACRAHRLIQGIRDHKDLEMRAIMKPFHVLSGLLQELESDVAEVPGNGGGDRDGGANNNAEDNNINNDNQISTSTNNAQTAGIQKKWWNLAGYPPSLSEREATIKVARHLCTAGGAPEAQSDARLSRSFFRHHWPQFVTPVPGQSQNGGGVDLHFARTGFVRNGDDPNDAGLAWPFPSWKAWAVGLFQLSEDEHYEVDSMRQLFPKFTISLVAACLVMAIPPLGTRDTVDFNARVRVSLEHRALRCPNGINGSLAYFLRRIARLAITAPNLLPGPFSWLSSSAHEKLAPWQYKFKLLLISVISRITCTPCPGSRLATVIQETLKRLRDSAAKPTASEALKEDYWHFKQGIVGEPCKDEVEWEEKLSKMEMRWQEGLTRNRDAGYFILREEALLSIAQQAKCIEGVGKRPEKSYKLKKETVLQLDI